MAKVLRPTEFPAVDDALLARLDVAGPRYTSYPTVPEWTAAFGPAHAATAFERLGDRDLSLYVHIPFCRALCNYCGCHVVVSHDPVRHGRYVDTLIAELDLVVAALRTRRRLVRLHLGGGTPTSLDEVQLERLGRAILTRFDLAPGAEVAVEVDPRVTSAGQLAVLRALGWNRVSMGVQDLDPAVQAAIGRVQSLEQTRSLIDAARAMGYGSVNVDLIYGLPRQTPASWKKTLDDVITELAPDRLALFSFAFLPALRPNQRRLPMAEVPSGAAKLAFLAAAYDQLVGRGYQAVGMDHFARPGDDLARAAQEGNVGRDFQGYTAGRAPATIGIGVSAISSLGEAYVQNQKRIGQWTAAVEAGFLPAERGVWLDAEDRERRERITEILCNGETSTAGLGGDELDELAAHARAGLVTLADGRVTLTPLGWAFPRNVAMTFDARLRRHAQRPVFSRTV